MTRIILSAGLLALVAACGGSPKPTAQLSQAEKNIERARAVGAQDTPAAALHLKMATDQLTEAKQQMAEDENGAAEHNLRRAISDAELAEALCREQKATVEARNNDQKLEKLRRGGAAEPEMSEEPRHD